MPSSSENFNKIVSKTAVLGQQTIHPTPLQLKGSAWKTVKLVSAGGCWSHGAGILQERDKLRKQLARLPSDEREPRESIK